MLKCPICGNSTKNEWRHCPKVENQLICGSEHCKNCEHWRKEEDKGTLWCTYWHGYKNVEKVKESKLAELEKQLQNKDLEIKRLFNTNKPKKAEDEIWEFVKIQNKIKELKDVT